MAAHHVTVTLGAGATPILTPAANSPSNNCTEVQIESETGNADVKVGGSTVSSTDYGRTVVAGPTGAITIRPAGRNINLSSTYLIGTQNQKVHVLYFT